MQRPSALPLLLCDQVIIDAETRKRSYIGIFDSLTSEAFPFVAPPFAVATSLTDGQGRMTLTLTVSDIDGEVVLINDERPLDIPSPLDIGYYRVRFRGLTFPQPGQYLFELSVGGEDIAYRRLQIHQDE